MGSYLLKNIKGWVVFGILSAVCLLTYQNSLHNPFMIDDHTVFSDVKIKNVKFLLNSFVIPTHNPEHGQSFIASSDYYRPLAYVFYILSYYVFGNDPFGYHSLSLFLFILMSFTLYKFIEILFKDRILSLLTALLFAVHPINVFYVDYFGSIHSLRFILMFLSLILFMKGIQGAHRILLYSLSLLCYVTSLLCHETSIVLPFYILFVSVYRSKGDVKGAVIKTWPYFVVFLMFILFRFEITGIPGQLSSNLTHFDPSKLIFITAAFSKIMYLYFSKLLFPDFIVFGWNVQPNDKFFYIWIGGLFILCAAWYRLFRAGAKNISFFCATWMLIGFLPVTVASLSIPPMGLIIEPQWLTFSSIAFFLYIARGVLRLYASMNKRFVGTAFILLCLILISITRFNNWMWGDEIRFYDYWQENIEGFNGSHGNDLVMGNIYLGKKNYRLARYYYQKIARSGQPGYAAEVYSNLGLIDFRLGNLEFAQKEFLLSLRSNPDNAFALNNLAVIYRNQLNYKLAKEFLLRALGLDKYSIETRLNLAYIFEKESNYRKAVRLYNENLNIVPYEERSLLALVEDGVQSGDEASVKKYSPLIIEHVQNPAVLTELGSVLAGSGLISMASDAFGQAIRVNPRYEQAYLEGGKLLANTGKYKEAIRVWQIGESVDPNDPGFRDNIAKVKHARMD